MTAPINSGNCQELYTIIGSAGISLLLIISEVLPFVTNVKSNGIIQSIINVISPKNKEKITDSESGDDLFVDDQP